MNVVRRRTPALLLFAGALCSLLAACGSGGSGDASTRRGDQPPAQGGDVPPGGGNPPVNATLTAWAISTAGNTGQATNLLEAGDSFTAETDMNVASGLWDGFWARLSGQVQWTGSNPLNTYRFRIDPDPKTNWGRSYRYSGYNVLEGPIRTPRGNGIIVGAGRYRRADRREFDAMILQTWDDTYWQILIFAANDTFVLANQHSDGFPILETYTSR